MYPSIFFGLFKEIIHLLSALNMEHKKQNALYFPKHSAIELHVTISGAEQQIFKLRAPRSSMYEYKRRKGRNLEADVRNEKSDMDSIYRKE
jgi:hypothetical protein